MQAARLLEMLNAAEAAAIAAAEWAGKGDKVAANQAAATAMRKALNGIEFSGRIVIGEGGRDETPVLFNGEEVGKGGEGLDLAVDPLEGANLCVASQANSIAAIAIAPRGSFLSAPNTYMWKIAAGPECKGKVTLAQSPAENVAAAAQALGKDVSDLNVCILERDRHRALIKEVLDAGARVHLITDGDVFGSIATAVPGTGIDLYMGSGGSPEGVLACTGLKAIGGVFEGRLAFDLDKHGAEKREHAGEMSSLPDLDSILTMDMLVGGDDAAFIACGVTDGEMLAGVSKAAGSVTTTSLLMNASDCTIRFIKAIHCGADGTAGL